MRNIYLPEPTTRDIDARISKILKDLDNPSPPLDVKTVRELLRLDLRYYSSSDGGVLQETIHRLFVAGKQVVARPSLLWEVVKSCELKALWVPDRKRILIDQELHDSKKRWAEAHEIGHSILPWHESATHGDKKQTLSLACEQQVETEANYAAGRLLFLQDQFTEHLFDETLSFDGIKKLQKQFGNTLTSTLWRAVEDSTACTFGLVSQHPKRKLEDEPLRYFVRSRRFESQFQNVIPMGLFQNLQTFCRSSRGGPLGEKQAVLEDLAGGKHVFLVECFFNGYDALTLGTYQYAKVAAVSVSGG